MIFHELPLAGTYLIELEPHRDERGQFARAWCRDELRRHGLATDFVQGNISVNPATGTLRGLHYQLPPHGEVKLVRCVRGAIYDVVVDVRPDSLTFLEWIGIDLSPKEMRMLYVPEGIAHGFQTVAPDSEINYLVTSPYAPAAGAGVRYDDPVFDIDWPLPVTRISDQDRRWPLLDVRMPSSAVQSR